MGEDSVPYRDRGDAKLGDRGRRDRGDTKLGDRGRGDASLFMGVIMVRSLQEVILSSVYRGVPEKGVSGLGG